MNYLLDTHLIIWAALNDERLPSEARSLFADPQNKLWFSVVTLWETAIKSALGRPDFRVDVATMRAGLLATGYVELQIAGRHTLALRDMPAAHRDPFDRLLIAQAKSEGLILVTADREMARYSGPIRLV